jgi:hypothetical protein
MFFLLNKFLLVTHRGEMVPDETEKGKAILLDDYKSGKRERRNSEGDLYQALKGVYSDGIV